MIAKNSQLKELLHHIKGESRVAIDTEADSLHCYREKLCLLQISVSAGDYIVDPLADLDLAPLRQALAGKCIVLHGADFDLRLLRRNLDFKPDRVFDTVIAARLLGIREFSLAALVQRYFNVELTKGSQKANWAQRPLPQRMIDYAMNDTHYLLPMAARMEAELEERGRLEWFDQSCQRALDVSVVDRTRDMEEAWRISGAGKLRGQAAAVLRELWRWRDREAEAADRPAFHILQNRELIHAAERFVAGDTPDYRHFSARRRQAFRNAAERGLTMPESEWPAPPAPLGKRLTPEILRRSDALRQRRDEVTSELGLDPAFVAARGTLDAIALNPESASSLLTPWQRQLLALDGETPELAKGLA